MNKKLENFLKLDTSEIIQSEEGYHLLKAMVKETGESSEAVMNVLKEYEEKQAIEKLIDEAETKNFWIHIDYQNIWYSPQEMRDEIKELGRARFHSNNWNIRDPKEHLRYLTDKARQAVSELRQFEKQLMG